MCFPVQRSLQKKKNWSILKTSLLLSPLVWIKHLFFKGWKIFNRIQKAQVEDPVIWPEMRYILYIFKNIPTFVELNYFSILNNHLFIPRATPKSTNLCFMGKLLLCSFFEVLTVLWAEPSAVFMISNLGSLQFSQCFLKN